MVPSDTFLEPLSTPCNDLLPWRASKWEFRGHHVGMPVKCRWGREDHIGTFAAESLADMLLLPDHPVGIRHYVLFTFISKISSTFLAISPATKSMGCLVLIGKGTQGSRNLNSMLLENFGDHDQVWEPGD